MPCIIIRTGNVAKSPNLQGLSGEISTAIGMDISRVNILVEYFEEKNQFTGMNPDKMIIAVYASENHENQFVEKMMKSVAELSEIYFEKPKGSAEVMCNLIKSGRLFAGNKFI